MDDILLSQQMQEAKIQIEKTINGIVGIEKSLLLKNMDGFRIFIETTVFIVLSVFVYIYGLRYTDYFAQHETLLQGANLYWCVPALVVGFAAYFLLLGLKGLISLKRVLVTRRAISGLYKLKAYLESQGAGLSALKDEFIKLSSVGTTLDGTPLGDTSSAEAAPATPENRGIILSPLINVQQELRRYGKTIPQNAEKRLGRIVRPVLKILITFTGILALVYFAFGYNGSFSTLKKGTVEAEIRPVTVYEMRAIVVTREGADYPLIQEEGYVDLTKDLKDQEFLGGKIRGDLNLRKGYTTSSEVINVMKPNDNLFLLGEKDGWYFGWYYEGKVYGWASGKYISLMKSCNKPLGEMWREQGPIGDSID